MKVKELIEFLEEQPQDLDVIYSMCSDYALLEADDIVIAEACLPRPDGWVQSERPDMESKEYLVFPGN